MSHTPGPWVVDDDRKAKRGKKSVNLGVLMVVAERGGMPGLVVNQPPVITQTDEANAHLIAAAPDLLEACKALLCSWGEQYFIASYPQIERAVAKAEGRNLTACELNKSLLKEMPSVLNLGASK